VRSDYNSSKQGPNSINVSISTMPKITSILLRGRESRTASLKARLQPLQQGATNLRSEARVISFEKCRSSSLLSCSSDDEPHGSSTYKIYSQAHSPRRAAGSLMRSKRRGQSTDLRSLASLDCSETESTSSCHSKEEEFSTSQNKALQSECEAWGQFVDVIPPEDVLCSFNLGTSSCGLWERYGAARSISRRRHANHPYLHSIGAILQKGVNNLESHHRIRSLVSPPLSANLEHLTDSECFSLDEESYTLLENKMKNMNV